MDAALRDPQIPDGERTVYRGSVRSSEVGAGTLTVEAREDAYLQFPTGPFPWNPRGLIEATRLD